MINQIWFGTSYIYNPNKSTYALSKLMLLFKDGIHQYFNLEETKNPKEFIQLINNKKLSDGDMLFIMWFKDKMPLINYYLNKDLPENELLVSQLEYEYHILEQEMGMLYPEDLRACLVDIINDLPDRIKKIN